MKRLFSFLCLALSCLALSAQQKSKIDEAIALYQAKNYLEAIPLLRAAAEQGSAKAQHLMGDTNAQKRLAALGVSY